MNERPVCHRSEDLVTYLYNEASAVDARDFAAHLEACEACRAEFSVFSQVHESISLWRSESLGASFNPAPVATEAVADSSRFVHHERKLSAPAALREFFSVSPLWLRGATAFAALLLCALAVLTIARLTQRQPDIARAGAQSGFSRQDIDRARQEGVAEGIARASKENATQATQKETKTGIVKSPKSEKSIQVAVMQTSPRTQRLSRQERIQLAADLRLTPGLDDEELPFGLLEQSNPEEPNQ